jgi:hypothetical protein
MTLHRYLWWVRWGVRIMIFKAFVLLLILWANAFHISDTATNLTGCSLMGRREGTGSAPVLYHPGCTSTVPVLSAASLSARAEP